jgi:sugar phosphate permease
VSSSAPKTCKPGTTIFYGWYVLAASFVILFLSSGVRLVIGVMIKPMIAELGWSRSAVSFAVFLNMFVFAISVIVVGKLYDRYGPKWVIIVSTILFSAGTMLTAVITSLWQFLLLYGLLAAAGTGGITAALLSSLMCKWFDKNRGLAISLGLSGACIGQFVIVPVFTHAVSEYGWRLSNLWCGVVILVVNIVLALWILRGDPEDLGLAPYGCNLKQENREAEPSTEETPKTADLGLLQAMRTPSFWFFSFVMFVCGSGDFLVSTHLVPLATDQGFSAAVGGNMLAWFGLLSLGGILVAGPASDLFGNKIPLALTFVIRVFLFILILKHRDAVSFYVFSLAFGFTFFITAPLATTLTGKLYGFSHVGVISGLITTLHHMGGGLWAYLGGAIFDRTGSYDVAFVLSAGMSFLAVIFSVLIREKRHHSKSSGE